MPTSRYSVSGLIALLQCLVHAAPIRLTARHMLWLRRQGFVLCLLAVVALALTWPLSEHAIVADWAESAANLAVALIFFQQGLSLATRQMLAGRLPLRLHVFVLGWNFVLFPALAALFNAPLTLILGRELTTGMWMLAILPTTIASATALTAAARGAVPQAVFASIFSNLLAVVLVPLLAVAYLAGASGAELSLMPVFTKLCWLVVIPLVLGQCLRRCFRQWAIQLSLRTRWLPQAAILFIVYQSFAQTAASGVMDSLSTQYLISALLGVSLFLLLANWAVWRSSDWIKLPYDQRVAAFFTASQKSLATGLPLLTAIFAASSIPMDVAMILVPLLIYHALQLLLGGILVPRLLAGEQNRRG